MMGISTDTLLLLKTLDLAITDHHVDWAVGRLVEGIDTPNIRILAGLDPKTEWQAVEYHFGEACGEIDLELLPHDSTSRDLAPLVKRAFDLKDISAGEAIALMKRLYFRSEFDNRKGLHFRKDLADELLTHFNDAWEQFQYLGQDIPYEYYPLKEDDTEDSVFLREWNLYERTVKLGLPDHIPLMDLCQNCCAIGRFELLPKFLWFGYKMRCPKCLSTLRSSVSSPKIRDHILTRLEKEGTNDVFGPTP